MSLTIDYGIMQTSMVERLAQNLMVFNEASRYGLAMVSTIIKGAIQKKSFYKKASGADRRDTTETMAFNRIANDVVNDIKLKRVSAYDTIISEFKEQSGSTEELSRVIGIYFADDMMQTWVNDAIGTLAAVVQGNAGMSATTVGDTTETLTQRGLVKGVKLFGDNHASVVSYLCHSTPFFDLIAEGIESANETLFSMFGLTIYSGSAATMNRPIIVTDCDDLVISGTPDTYVTLVLTENAVTVTDSYVADDITDNTTVEGNEAVYEAKRQFAYNLAIKGYSYTSATMNPAEATLKNAASWTKKLDDKQTAASVVISK